MSAKSDTANLLIELGTEELPAGPAPRMMAALGEAVAGLLDEEGLAHGAVTGLGTPRRITVHVADVQSRQPDRVDEITGPPAKVAFQSGGAATRAGEGFARGQGMKAEDLYTVTTAKGDYAALKKTVIGRTAAAIIGDALPGILRGLPQPKRMRWLQGVDGFIRPVRWLVALLGDDVLDVSFVGKKASKASRGHRFFADRAIDVTSELDGYVAALADAKVMVRPEQRRDAILEGARQIAADAGGELVADEETLATVSWLVEWPLPLLGRFDDAFLQIPAEVVLTTLKSHQKLFCVRAVAQDGADAQSAALLPCFVAVANTLTDASTETVAEGNAKVVAARLADARFFYTEDLKAELGSYVAKLDRRIWLQGLGTVADKVARIQRLAIAIAKRIQTADMTAVERGAWLCKADLETRMVGEFPSLQGIIGEHYAGKNGEPASVRATIAEHYLPRFAGDKLPQSEAGAIVAIADRLDSIVGCFGIGLVPTGAQDPYALRRAALGVLHILADRRWSIGLAELVKIARQGLPSAAFKAEPAELDAQLATFFRGRLKASHQGDYATDLVDAVLDAGFDDVASVLARLDALATMQSTDAFEPLAVTFKRVGNIVAKSGQSDDSAASSPVAELFESDAERDLFAKLNDVANAVAGSLEDGSYDAALGHLSSLRPTVDRFFDDVMVMAEDPEVRRNRLALMQQTGSMFASIADFTRIQSRRG